jgi:CBS domain containing-hemolysin-like protein
MSGLRDLFRGPQSGRREAHAPLGDDAEMLPDSDRSHERKLIENILEIRDQPVSDLMVPRADIVAVESHTERDALLRLLVDRSHSRLPVYRDTLDEVIGIVHIKDVLANIAGGGDFSLEAIVRPVSIVAPSIRVLDLLLDMRKTHQHMALVIDEFGGIDGLITIEDLVEGIVGEITDEHDRAVSASMIEKADGSLLADARVPIEDFEERVGPVLEQDERDEVDTLGGLVFSLAGRVPSRGELLTHPSSGLEFEIIDADPRRIKRIRVRNPPPPPAHK